MKSKVGEFDVLESGSVIGNENEPIDFIYEEVGFVLRFIFITDDLNGKRTANAERFGEKGVQITFTNYNNSMGIGNAVPIKVGKYNKRELFLNYRIYALEATAGKLVHYTWLLGKEITSGK
jgi:hypothetical protein